MIIPVSTYRLQFNKNFTFKDAERIVPYLKQLGISTIYASPIFAAKPGSMHGYDIVEPNSLNPELGTEDDFYSLINTVKKNGLSWLQDIVPNHMSYSGQNQMLTDLLENGPSSRYFEFFDIEWNHPHQSVRDRILSPFLGKFYKDALECGELKLQYNESGFSVKYFETTMPLKMESYVELLSRRLPQLRNKIGRNAPDTIKYLGVLYVLKSLAGVDDIDERYSQIKFAKGMIWELYISNQEIKMSIDETIKLYNGEPGNADSFNFLDKILRDQYFRLAYWKVANEEINYRRFFTVSELISLRMELEQVFNRTHSLILKYVKEDLFQGLRIDHVDGLYDPAKYLSRLRERAKNAYIVVEKILELNEELPDNWSIEGTTGYEFMNYVNGLFIRKENEEKLTNVYENFTGFTVPFGTLMFEKKRLIITSRMAGEVERLAFLVEEVSSQDRFGIDITMTGIKRSLEEVLTYFPIYRTYINNKDYSERDKEYIAQVFKRVREEVPLYEHEYNYIERLLRKEFNYFNENQKQKGLDFIMKFQQLTGPLMAKGFEDTTLYIYNRLISQNEVGGCPGIFGATDKQFHSFNQKKIEKRQNTMNASSTHDTKRGEDVRARINVLSEIPDMWQEKLTSWNELNRRHKTLLNNKNFPDRNDELFLYQTLIGSYPPEDHDHQNYIDRIKEYVIKSVREAKIYTAWIKPDETYENAYLKFVDNILMQDEGNIFLKDMIEFTKYVSWYGMFNSLSQLIIKITSPGLPDFYQGTELWDLSLVDPDNRNPVEYDRRVSLLKKVTQLEDNDSGKLLNKLTLDYHTGEIKMFITAHALEFRRNNIDLFREGSYKPLMVNGKREKNLFGFVREKKGNRIMVVVPRFITDLAEEGKMPVGKEIWDETFIVQEDFFSGWKNCLTGDIIEKGKSIDAGELFKTFPIALLKSE